tara:strand:- start:4126 stop:4749 length:624 start_codon:yes stop_codon:yes gene_type:complete
MNVLEQLASALDRRDEVPNQELARKIASTKDSVAVKILVENLNHKDKAIQSDCIKVLYEIAEIDPQLVADYARVFIEFLKHKNNRLQWGAMTALNAICLENPSFIYKALPQIVEAGEKGSVITKDNLVKLLVKMASLAEYADDAFDLLCEQVLRSPTNQLPMYAELALPIITDPNKKKFSEILQSRLNEVEKESKRKRLEKVIKKLT